MYTFLHPYEEETKVHPGTVLQDLTFQNKKTKGSKQWHFRRQDKSHIFSLGILDLLYILSGEISQKKKKKREEIITYFCFLKEYVRYIAGSHWCVVCNSYDMYPWEIVLKRSHNEYADQIHFITSIIYSEYVFITIM